MYFSRQTKSSFAKFSAVLALHAFSITVVTHSSKEKQLQLRLLTILLLLKFINSLFKRHMRVNVNIQRFSHDRVVNIYTDVIRIYR
jgi:hypothetical protein